MYKIFTDKGKLFKCNIDISGASMKDCHARLLETDDNIFLYKGKVIVNMWMRYLRYKKTLK
jgi:hypothetical protein